VPLGDDAAVLVDECEAAAEVVADDGEKGLEPATLEDSCGQPLARCVTAAFVIATNGISYGTARTGKASLFASSTIGAGTSGKPKPTPNPSPASPCLASRFT
jgi:hypothetical protein